MIINTVDQSALSDLTHRTILLQKQNESEIVSFNSRKDKRFQIIKDKSVYEVIEKTQDQTIRQNLKSFYQNFNLIRPESKFIVTWNVINLIIIIYFLMEFPLIFGYGQVVWIDVYTEILPLIIIFILILAADIVLTPLKMVYKEGLLVKDKQILLKDYLKMKFWIDLIGLLSIVIPLISKEYLFANLVKILFLGKIVILNQINDKIVGVLVFRNTAKTFYLIGRLVIFIIMIAHYIGIGYFVISYWIYANNIYGPNTPNICWIYNAQAYSQIILLLDWRGQYLYTMYFSIGMTTTIAYGDITPLNPIQAIYIIVALIINTLAFGYILSEVLRILIQAFYADFTKKNIKYTMQNILVSRKINPKLRQLIRAHMEQIQKQQMYRDRVVQRKVIETLPFNLQIGLYGKVYGQFMQSLKLTSQPFYIDKNRNSRFIQKILLNITQTRYLVGDLIYKQKQQYTQEINNHKCYFLKDKNQKKSIILGVGKSPKIDIENHEIIDQDNYMIFKNDRQIFGEQQFLTGSPRSHWIMSKDNILIYQLPRKAFQTGLRYANKKQIQYLTQLKEKITNSYCYICYQEHNFKKCPKTTYLPDVLQSVLKINEKEKMKRKHSSKIQDTRAKRLNQSLKSNALRNYKYYSGQKDKKALAKSQLRMLAHSKHYRKMFHQHHEHQHDDSSSITSSDTSQEDLDYLINETKMLISNLNKNESQRNQIYQKQFFEYDFDLYYAYEDYKPKDNYERVLSKLSDLQKIYKSKTKISLSLMNRRYQ